MENTADISRESSVESSLDAQQMDIDDCKSLLYVFSDQ